MKPIFIGLSILLIVTLGYAMAHGDDVNEDSDVELHRQHHIEMHGDDEGFNEMHEMCEKMHENGVDMAEHYKMMHGGM